MAEPAALQALVPLSNTAEHQVLAAAKKECILLCLLSSFGFLVALLGAAAGFCASGAVVSRLFPSAGDFAPSVCCLLLASVASALASPLGVLPVPGSLAAIAGSWVACGWHESTGKTALTATALELDCLTFLRRKYAGHQQHTTVTQCWG